MGFICERCGNDNLKCVGYLNGKPYCRKCISFKGKEVSYNKPIPKEAPLNLHYSLSQEQAKLSEEIVMNYKNRLLNLNYVKN